LTFRPLEFVPLVTLVQRYVSTKLEVSTTFLVQENHKHGMDGWTNGRSATLNVPYRESSIIILPSQKAKGSFVFCDFVVKSTYVKFIERLMHSVLHSFIHTFIQFFNYRNVKTHFHM